MLFEELAILNLMLFEEFQDGRHGGRLGYWIGTIFNKSECPYLPNASHQDSP